MKKTKYFLMVILAIFLLAGCEKEEEVKSEYSIYYVNNEETKLISEAYKAGESDTLNMLKEMIGLLTAVMDSPDYKAVCPDFVKIKNYVVDNQQLYIEFNEEYSKMDKTREVLCRAAIVKTLIQIPEIECISFYVQDMPLADSHGKPIGLMTADSFVENPGKQINSIQSTTLNLYFADATGNYLVKEAQKVHYVSNISLEKLILERLIAGPTQENAYRTLPKETKTVSVSIQDGICYVNFDEKFLEYDYHISESVVLYSIVNSLEELPNINKVQISVNGNTNMFYRESISLDTLFVRNLDLFQSDVKKSTEETEVRLIDD